VLFIMCGYSQSSQFLVDGVTPSTRIQISNVHFPCMVFAGSGLNVVTINLNNYSPQMYLNDPLFTAQNTPIAVTSVRVYPEAGVLIVSGNYHAPANQGLSIGSFTTYRINQNAESYTTPGVVPNRIYTWLIYNLLYYDTIWTNIMNGTQITSSSSGLEMSCPNLTLWNAFKQVDMDTTYNSHPLYYDGSSYVYILTPFLVRVPVYLQFSDEYQVFVASFGSVEYLLYLTFNSIAADSQGTIYLTDAMNVYQYDPKSNSLTEIITGLVSKSSIFLAYYSNSLYLSGSFSGTTLLQYDLATKMLVGMNTSPIINGQFSILQNSGVTRDLHIVGAICMVFISYLLL